MEFCFHIDWGILFIPQLSLPELIIRGVLVYLSLCLMLRLVLKRQTGQASLSDLLVVTLVAGVCRNPLIRDAYSITDGILVVAVVLMCSYAVDWLCYYVPSIHRLLHAPPVPLLRDGQVLSENLHQELMTPSQLRSKLRQHGVGDPAEAAEVILEGTGQISVIKRQDTAAEQRGAALSQRPPRPEKACRCQAQPEGCRSEDATQSDRLHGPAKNCLHGERPLYQLLAWHQEQVVRIQELLALPIAREIDQPLP